MPGRRVVITGVGAVTPLARGAEATFDRAHQGRSGIGPITSFATTGLPCAVAGEVDDAWLDPPGGRPSDLGGRGVRLLLTAAGEAARQACLDRLPEPEAFAVVVGSHGDNPPLGDLVRLHRFIGEDGVTDPGGLLAAGGYDALQFVRRKSDVASAILADRLGAAGPCLSVASACAAGTQAIGEAMRLVRDHRCEIAAAGGCESNLNFVGFLGFVLLRALAERVDPPEAASRPFDRRRSGFVLAEGAAVVILESLDHARARGATVLCEILGYGDSADAYRITDSPPDGRGAALAMSAALDDAGVAPGDVEVINAHGTATVQGDLGEARAIHHVFGPRARTIPVTANKSMLGHTIAAAGAVECILTAIGLQRSVVLPTINLETPDPRCDLNVIAHRARRLEHRVALSNSFGFGGQNGCLCLGRWDG